jgi:uncharacterized protein
MPEKMVDPAPDERAQDADDDISDDAAWRFARYDPTGDEANDEPEDNPGENSHGALLSRSRSKTGTQAASGAGLPIMKRTFICLLATFAVLANTAATVAASTTEITASGSGSVSLPPDTATVNAAVETNAENANDAISQNNAIYDRVVGALTKLAISRGDIALAYYNVNYNPRPAAAPANPGERYGYTVSRSFSIKVRDIAAAGRVSDACIGAGATAINAVTFGLADPSSARAQATAKAVAQARMNAQALAHAASLRIVAIKSIELLGGGQAPVPLMRAAAAPSMPTEFDQSNVNVTVSVSVVFLAEP